MNNTFLYTNSFKEAQNTDEVALYHQSKQANVECKDFIENLLFENFDNGKLDKNTAKQIIEEFGIDRTSFVLANTIQQREEPRFSVENIAFAKETHFFDDIDNRIDYMLSGHVGVVNLLTYQFKEEYKSLDLWDKTQVNDTKGLDFTDKIMILKPNTLKDEYKTRDDQLFLAKSGFGCDPKSLGTKVFGIFLKDGEQTSFNRQDFLGEAKKELLPKFAKDMLPKKSVTEKLENAKEKVEIKENPTKPKDKSR